MELSKSLADDIEESWNTERVLGDQTRREADKAPVVEGRNDWEGQNEVLEADTEADILEVPRTAE